MKIKNALIFSALIFSAPFVSAQDIYRFDNTAIVKQSDSTGYFLEKNQAGELCVLFVRIENNEIYPLVDNINTSSVKDFVETTGIQISEDQTQLNDGAFALHIVPSKDQKSSVNFRFSKAPATPLFESGDKIATIEGGQIIFTIEETADVSASGENEVEKLKMNRLVGAEFYHFLRSTILLFLEKQVEGIESFDISLDFLAKTDGFSSFLRFFPESNKAFPSITDLKPKEDDKKVDKSSDSKADKSSGSKADKSSGNKADNKNQYGKYLRIFTFFTFTGIGSFAAFLIMRRFRFI